MIQSEKKLGIWLDHSNAHLMELINNSISTTTVESTFSHAKKNETIEKSEQLMHNKEQHEQLAYYESVRRNHFILYQCNSIWPYRCEN